MDFLNGYRHPPRQAGAARRLHASAEVSLQVPADWGGVAPMGGITSSYFNRFYKNCSISWTSQNTYE